MTIIHTSEVVISNEMFARMFCELDDHNQAKILQLISEKFGALEGGAGGRQVAAIGNRIREGFFGDTQGADGAANLIYDINHAIRFKSIKPS